MKVVRLDQIRLDGGTQMREHLDQNVVKEYAEKMRQGEVFPPLITMFDGSTHWLVDGFHRYFAIQAAGKQGHLCEVHEGTLEDAIFMATSVNGTHGLLRSNATKRKCVEVALASPKTVGWSNKQIAKHCGVSDVFVASIRNPETKERQADQVEKHYEKKVSSKVGVSAIQLSPSSVGSFEESPIPTDDFGPSPEEIRASERAHEEFLETMQEMLASDDVLNDTAEKLKQALLEIHHLKITNNGLINTNTELTKMVKSLQRQLDKAKK
jgi:hypothetical protein